MRNLKFIVIPLLVMGINAALAAPRFENRCGWFFNPTPGNAFFTDKDGEWIVGAQGGYQAEGDWPEFSSSQWVNTNGYYGYGCACLSVSTDLTNMYVVKIRSSRALPLSRCRNDRAISVYEPKP